MDKWNRNDENEYTGVTAQRRNRRRITDADEKPAAPEQPAVPEEAEVSAELSVTEAPAVSADPETPEEPAVTAEPAAGEEPENPTMPIRPIRYEVPEETKASEEPEEAAGMETSGEPPVSAEPVVQGADSRVPPEARRMAAQPYGVPREGAKRPGTRPQVAPKRPPLPEERRPAPRPRREAPSAEALRGSANRQERAQRVSVGYAPGRMTDDATMQMPTADAARESLYGRNAARGSAYDREAARAIYGRDAAREPGYGRDAKAYLEKRKQPFRTEEGNQRLKDSPGHKALRVIVALLVVAGLILTGWMLLKGRNSGDAAGNRGVPQVYSFDSQKTEGLIAPQDLIFSAETEKSVQEVRLTADGDRDVETDVKGGVNGDRKIWMISMHIETGFTGTVTLQVRRNEEEDWISTDRTAVVNVSTPIGVEVPEEEKQPDAVDPEDDDYYDPDAEEDAAGGQPEQAAPAAAGQEAQPTEAPTEKPAEQPDEETVEDWTEGEPAVVSTPAPTPTPTVEQPTATPTPPLTAEAAPEANPNLITNTTVWTGVAKKEKDYNRAAKEQIHMPVADEYKYSKQEIGVLTFRGDNFRRNAAAGRLSGTPQKMSILWQTEAGTAKGINTTYYGYEWTGQPVIARWSTEVRTKSNLTDSKIEKAALKEVIIAGVDGSVRFLDLEDGKFTRNSIRLNYPMRGTPSLDPRGFPFMTVGQLTRKMKGRTAGKIGLRQYNLYSQKELKIIDGLDGKYHRPLNDIGSFETSALIDRESDTLIVAGTNGMLYLEYLDTNFDYKLGVLTNSPTVVAMSSRAKGQKNNALVAVESSLAAYDKYVFYADMGGVLRCVDTNTLRHVWAVETGDSVMAAVALDLTENRELNLYTANMYNNRKRGNGNVQIRRYDALSGKEIWCVDVGVFKGKKDKQKDNVGAKASPVIGQNKLDDLVYFTVTGLSEEGAGKLGLSADTPAALIALDKDDGQVVWAYGLGSRSESSPIALYDKQGNGWIVQCEQSGRIHLLEGLNGREVASVQVDGDIEASPAAYNNVVVIGTTGKGKANVYGIEVKLDKSADEGNAEAPAENTAEEGSGEAADNGAAEEAEAENAEEAGEDEEGPEPELDEYEEYEAYEPDDDEESGDGRQ